MASFTQDDLNRLHDVLSTYEQGAGVPEIHMDTGWEDGFIRRLFRNLRDEGLCEDTGTKRRGKLPGKAPRQYKVWKALEAPEVVEPQPHQDLDDLRAALQRTNEAAAKLFGPDWLTQASA